MAAPEMTEHGNLDKSDWGPGPWQEEPDRLEWQYNQLPCLIVRADLTGALCGYVGCSPGHPWHGKDFGNVPVDVHGGLTYGAACSGHICHVPLPGATDDVWWLGFDCAHAYDFAPAMHAKLGKIMPQRIPEGTYCNLSYVRAEVERLADQVAAASP